MALEAEATAKARKMTFPVVGRLPVCGVLSSDNQAASWTWARANRRSKVFPQTIAHRGFKAEHPENTMKAFKGAVEVGSHAIETDIHLSKDDVVVLSHVRCPLFDRICD